MSVFSFCNFSVEPGRTVDLITATLFLPINFNTRLTIPKSKPLGVVGVGTAIKTISQFFIFSLFLIYGSS